MRSISQLPDDLRKIISAAPDAWLEAERATGKKAFEMVYIKSSGPFSYAMLAAMDHPYATRHGAPQSDPSTINTQTGRFRASWMLNNPGWVNNVLVTSVTNDNPVSFYLKNGTRIMFNRPIDQWVIDAIVPFRELNINKATAKSFASLT